MSVVEGATIRPIRPNGGEREATVWAVVDGAAEVVLLCSGGDAAEVVDEWEHRGYRVVRLPPVQSGT